LILKSEVTKFENFCEIGIAEKKEREEKWFLQTLHNHGRKLAG
jgi:hypothetical protein